MPAVEAMGFGLPTIVSKTASLPEVTLNQAQYVEDFSSVNEWSSAIERSLDSLNDLRSKFESRKEEIISQYSPLEIAGRYLKAMDIEY